MKKKKPIKKKECRFLDFEIETNKNGFCIWVTEENGVRHWVVDASNVRKNAEISLGVKGVCDYEIEAVYNAETNGIKIIKHF